MWNETPTGKKLTQYITFKRLNVFRVIDIIPNNLYTFSSCCQQIYGRWQSHHHIWIIDCLRRREILRRQCEGILHACQIHITVRALWQVRLEPGGLARGTRPGLVLAARGERSLVSSPLAHMQKALGPSTCQEPAVIGGICRAGLLLDPWRGWRGGGAAGSLSRLVVSPALIWPGFNFLPTPEYLLAPKSKVLSPKYSRGWWECL